MSMMRTVHIYYAIFRAYLISQLEDYKKSVTDQDGAIPRDLLIIVPDGTWSMVCEFLQNVDDY